MRRNKRKAGRMHFRAKNRRWVCVCACVEQWVTLATASPTYATAKARVWTFMQIFWSFWDTHAHITSTPTHNMAWRGEKCANNIYSQHPATLTLHSLRTHEHKKKTCRTNMTHYLTLLTRVSFVFYLLPFCFWFRSVGLLPLLFLVEWHVFLANYYVWCCVVVLPTIFLFVFCCFFAHYSGALTAFALFNYLSFGANHKHVWFGQTRGH